MLMVVVSEHRKNCLQSICISTMKCNGMPKLYQLVARGYPASPCGSRCEVLKDVQPNRHEQSMCSAKPASNKVIPPLSGTERNPSLVGQGKETSQGLPALAVRRMDCVWKVGNLCLWSTEEISPYVSFLRSSARHLVECWISFSLMSCMREIARALWR